MRVLPVQAVLKRRSRLLTATIIVSVLSSVPLIAPLVEAAGVIEASANLSNTGNQSEVPSIATGGDKLGVVWGERQNTTIATSSATIDSGFSGQGNFNTGSSTAYQWPDIAVGSDGTMHMAYASGNTIYYRRKPSGSSWSGAVTVGSDSFPNPVRIALAPNGTIWVIWRQTDGEHLSFKFSDNNGAGWSGGSAGGLVAAETGNMSAPDLAVGPDNRPHVVWYLRSSGSAKGEIRYADWNGSRFVVGQLTNDGATLYDADPVITVDGNNVQHVAWRKQVTSSGNAWDIRYATRSGSGSWGGFVNLVTTSGDAKYSPGIGSDADGSVYVAYSEPGGASSSRSIVLFAKPSGQGSWDSALKLTGRRWDYRPSIAGTTATGTEAHVVFQSEQGQDDGEIFYRRVRYASTKPDPEASPALDGNALSTKNSTVAVSFSNVVGNPTQVRWNWGSAPTDADNDSGGWKTFANPLTVSLPAQTNGVCQAQILYTQVRTATKTQATAQRDDIVFDNAVQATAGGYNPDMSGVATAYNQGAQAGAGNYTRHNYFKQIISGSGDCVGLQSYQVNGGTAIGIAAGQVASQQQLMSSGEGSQNFNVAIRDTASNTLTFSEQIFYDKTAPVVNAATPSISGGNSLLQTITIPDANVSDNLYGQDEGLTTGRQFWGLFVATSRTNLATNDINANTDLRWTPLRVDNPNSSTISVDYNLLSGLSSTGLTGGAGTYYVYVKFIDGAGNPSVWTSDALQVSLTAGYTVQQNTLPTLLK